MSPSTALLSACGCGEKVYVDYNRPVMCTHSGILQESTLVDPSSDRPVMDNVYRSPVYPAICYIFPTEHAADQVIALASAIQFQFQE